MVDIYKSLFDKLPLIGKLPEFILGNEFMFGDTSIKLNDHPNFFKKLEWYEGREFTIGTVRCIENTWSGGRYVAKNELFIVDKIEFVDGKHHLLYLEDHHHPCQAKYFIPVIYEILDDEVNMRKKRIKDMDDPNKNPYLICA
jgi:hypothetical protein